MPDADQTNTPLPNPTPSAPAADAAIPSVPSDAPIDSSVADVTTPDASTPDVSTSDAPTPDISTSDTSAPDEPPIDSSESSSEDDDRAADIMSEIAAKLAESHNILIALSSDPSVDEMSAAIGISLCLDRTGKRATAIYSGSTPNALEFLRPDEVFETSADALQDFVVAIDKDKADHLRYKLDGDYVKIFITPYKTRISEDDLEFSYGDFNIDLVLALNVANGVDLDAALREHGRIMHDAEIVNITTGNPGKFGEIEWSDKKASSISEMIARLFLSMSRKLVIEQPDATALLTGIIAATDRFSNAKTTPVSLEVASELLKSGANRELISKNISGDGQDNPFTSNNNFTFAEEKSSKDEDVSSIDISHSDKPTGSDQDSVAEDANFKDSKDSKGHEEGITAAKSSAPILEAPAELTSSFMGATAPSDGTAGQPAATPSDVTPLGATEQAPEKIVAPSSDFQNGPTTGNKYGQMLEQALAESEPIMATSPAPSLAPAAPTIATVPAAPLDGISTPTTPTTPATPTASIISNPAVSAAPIVNANPEINGVPEMNFNAPGDILPPPPAPNIDTALPPTSDSALATPTINATPSIAAPVSMPSDMTAAPAATDAFQIPTANAA